MQAPRHFATLPTRELLTNSLSDEDVVVRVCSGETELFELLMRRHNRKVFRAARAIVRRDEEAEDVTQHAYVSAYEHLADFAGKARFSTWLVRIAVNEALARVRRERRFRGDDAPLEEASVPSSVSRPSPEQGACDAELRAVLDRAIDALPEEFRLTFVLRAVEQLSGAETADILGVPEQTVKTRLFRARERLQREIQTALEVEPSLELEPSVAYEFHFVRCDRVVAAVFASIEASHDPTPART